MTRPFDPFISRVGDLDDILVVSASAGTGKTWMITHVAARWLIEEDHEPHELLMVTFSRAAAFELKARLRERVAAIGVVIAWLETESRGDLADIDPSLSSSDEWVQAFAAVCLEQGLDVVRARWTRVTAQLDEVHARTIHSFASAVRHGRDEDVVAGGRLKRRASYEAITRRVTSADPVFLQLLDEMESSGTALTPAAQRLSSKLTKGLDVVESSGGEGSQLLSLHDPSDDPERAEQLSVITEVLRDATTRLARLHELENVTTYNDLIGELHHQIEIGGTALRDRLRSQFALVMIDEFQDTDALQWDVFRRLFRDGESPTPMIVVGDAKQAIYGFRGGDVRVYQRLEHDVSSRGRQASVALRVNHRSSGPLLSALNTLFLAGRRDGWHLSSGDNPVTYDPVEPSARRRDLPGQFTIRAVEASTVGPAVFEDVHHVLTVLREAGVPARDVAILCRRGDVMRRLQRDLARRNVVSVSVGGASVFTSVAAMHVRSLLWILADHRAARRVNLLRATWFQDFDDGNLQAIVDGFARSGPGALIRAALAGGVLAHVRSLPQGERHWTDLEHIFELLAADLHGPVSAERPLQWMDERMSDARVGDEEGTTAQRRVESDDDAVRLMTIHAAKGLQFPVVLIPDIERTSSLRTDGVASWTTGTGRVLDTRSLLSNEGFGEEVRLDDRDETRRLIYVALTRAETLLVAWRVGDRGEWPTLLTSLATSAADDLESDGPIPEVSRAEHSFALHIPWNALPDNSPQQPPVAQRAPAVAEALRRWSYSSLHTADNDADLASDIFRANSPSAYEGGARDERKDDELVEDVLDLRGAHVFGNLRGTGLGNAVHEVLERVVGRMGSRDEALDRVVRDVFTRHHFAATSEFVDVFRHLLSRPLGALFDGASLDDFVGARRTSAEMRFTLPLGSSNSDDGRLRALCDAVVTGDPEGPYRDFFAHVRDGYDSSLLATGYLTGSIDLVAQIGDSSPRFVVVDYKTNLLTSESDYSPSSLVNEMSTSGYPLQGLLYSVALHRYLDDRLAGYQPAEQLGGLCYLYVRGVATAQHPDDGLATWRIPADVVVLASDILAGDVP